MGWKVRKGGIFLRWHIIANARWVLIMIRIWRTLTLLYACLTVSRGAVRNVNLFVLINWVKLLSNRDAVFCEFWQILYFVSSPKSNISIISKIPTIFFIHKKYPEVMPWPIGVFSLIFSTYLLDGLLFYAIWDLLSIFFSQVSGYKKYQDIKIIIFGYFNSSIVYFLTYEDCYIEAHWSAQSVLCLHVVTAFENGIYVEN